MELSSGRFSYIGGALKQGIVVDPDLMTWSCFDGFCEEFLIEGGLVERVWWKLNHENMETVLMFCCFACRRLSPGFCLSLCFVANHSCQGAEYGAVREFQGAETISLTQPSQISE
ncbi:unnamed protein product [Microthlaspi erraticum]|uniref:Uncharacterized protein n=1 Tax=Microthlaspi erraticum TaxID=1685480 RepID=A0A6D2I5X2_9BRAS|nr:unnamed protein product [Microthlaspi erraticum]